MKLNIRYALLPKFKTIFNSLTNQEMVPILGSTLEASKGYSEASQSILELPTNKRILNSVVIMIPDYDRGTKRP